MSRWHAVLGGRLGPLRVLGAAQVPELAERGHKFMALLGVLGGQSADPVAELRRARGAAVRREFPDTANQWNGGTPPFGIASRVPVPADETSGLALFPPLE